MRPRLLAFILVCASIPVVVCSWLLGYHLTGKPGFDAWKAERIAKGDPPDWHALAPPQVDPSDNFAEAPLVRGAIMDKARMDPRWKALEPPAKVLAALGNWEEGRRDPLDRLRQAYGVKDFEDVFKPLAPALAELDQASRRRSSRLPVDWYQGQVPGLAGFRGAARTLRLRAIVNLRKGQGEAALADLMTCFRVARHLEREPSMLSTLLRRAILTSTMQVVWEGLEDHLWSANQIGQLQEQLARANLLASMKLAWQGDRQNLVESLSAAAGDRPPPIYLVDSGGPQARPGMLGRGWLYRNLQVACARMSMVVDTMDPPAHRVFPARLPDPERWNLGMTLRPDLVVARIALPAMTQEVINHARRQALIDEGVIACALERYRLGTGRYPDSLEALSPDFLDRLPTDLVAGGPIRYSRQGEGFSLYQVGWQGKDRQGRVEFTGEGGARRIDPARSDWAWPHAN